MNKSIALILFVAILVLSSFPDVQASQSKSWMQMEVGPLDASGIDDHETYLIGRSAISNEARRSHNKPQIQSAGKIKTDVNPNNAETEKAGGMAERQPSKKRPPKVKPDAQSPSDNSGTTVDFAYKLSQCFGPILSHWFKDKFAYSVVDKSKSLACS